MSNNLNDISSELKEINNTLNKIVEAIDPSLRIISSDNSEVTESPIDIEELAARIITKMKDLIVEEDKLKAIFEATMSREYITNYGGEFYKLSLEEDGFIDIEKIGL